MTTFMKVLHLLSALLAITSSPSRQAGSMLMILTVTLKVTPMTLAQILISHGVKSGTLTSIQTRSFRKVWGLCTGGGCVFPLSCLPQVALTVTIHRSMVNGTQRGEAWHAITSLSWLLQCPARACS